MAIFINIKNIKQFCSIVLWSIKKRFSTKSHILLKSRNIVSKNNGYILPPSSLTSQGKYHCMADLLFDWF